MNEFIFIILILWPEHINSNVLVRGDFSVEETGLTLEQCEAVRKNYIENEYGHIMQPRYSPCLKVTRAEAARLKVPR